MNPVELFKQYEAIRPAGERDLNLVPVGHVQGATMAKRQSQADMARLKSQYGGMLLGLIKTKVLTDAPASAVLELLKDDLADVEGVILLAADSLYEEWANLLWANSGGKFGLNQVFTLNTIIESMMTRQNLRWESIEGPWTAVSTKPEFKQAIRVAVRTKYGNNLVINGVLERVHNIAFQNQMDGDITLIIAGLEGAEFDDIEKMFTKAKTVVFPLNKQGKLDVKKLKKALSIKVETEEKDDNKV